MPANEPTAPPEVLYDTVRLPQHKIRELARLSARPDVDLSVEELASVGVDVLKMLFSQADSGLVLWIGEQGSGNLNRLRIHIPATSNPMFSTPPPDAGNVRLQPN